MVHALLTAALLAVQAQTAQPSVAPTAPAPQAENVTPVDVRAARPDSAQRAENTVRCEWRATTGNLVRQKVCRTERSATADRREAGAYLDELSRAASALPDQLPTP